MTDAEILELVKQFRPVIAEKIDWDWLDYCLPTELVNFLQALEPTSNHG
jgi:hypothetical protein